VVSGRMYGSSSSVEMTGILCTLSDRRYGTGKLKVSSICVGGLDTSSRDPCTLVLTVSVDQIFCIREPWLSDVGCDDDRIQHLSEAMSNAAS
jgi:hypothetical protein